MSYYDVRIGMDAQNQSWTTVVGSVNLMCELLKGISYSTLYEEPFWVNNSTTCASYALHLNSRNLPDGLKVDASGARHNTDVILSELFQSIIDRLSRPGTPPVRLKFLFLRDVSLTNTGDNTVDLENRALQDILILISNVLNTNPAGKMDHFCTPFLEMQNTKNFISDPDWNDYIGNCGRHTLRQLFSLERRCVTGNAVARARKLGILKDFSKQLPLLALAEKETSDTVRVLTPNGGNSRICRYGNSCVTSDPQNWCNLTEGGVCSSMSDHE